MALPLFEHVDVANTIKDAPMNGGYVTFTADEHVDNHGYDENTHDDHDLNNAVYGHIPN